MHYFVKAKWPAVETNGAMVNPVRKARFEERGAAFDFIAQALTDGAMSVTIRPEK